jgi:hypothetical protein
MIVYRRGQISSDGVVPVFQAVVGFVGVLRSDRDWSSNFPHYRRRAAAKDSHIPRAFRYQFRDFAGKFENFAADDHRIATSVRS